MYTGSKSIKMTSDNYKVCIDGLVNSDKKDTRIVDVNRNHKYIFRHGEIKDYYIFDYAFENDIIVKIKWIDGTPYKKMTFDYSLYTLD